MLMPNSRGDGFKYIMELCDGNKEDNKYVIVNYLTAILYSICFLYGLFIFIVSYRYVIFHGIRHCSVIPLYFLQLIV